MFYFIVVVDFSLFCLMKFAWDLYLRFWRGVGFVLYLNYEKNLNVLFI